MTRSDVPSNVSVPANVSGAPAAASVSAAGGLGDPATWSAVSAPVTRSDVPVDSPARSADSPEWSAGMGCAPTRPGSPPAVLGRRARPLPAPTRSVDPQACWWR